MKKGFACNHLLKVSREPHKRNEIFLCLQVSIKYYAERLVAKANIDYKEITSMDVSSHLINVSNPKRLDPYVVEVEDLIEALEMEFAEGTILKTLIRYCKLKTIFCVL